MKKKFEPWGRWNGTGKIFTLDDAKFYTYLTDEGEHIPTPIINDDNPFNDEIINSNNILEIGCGVGRNVQYLLDNTNSNYIGVDPNREMTKWFWDVVDKNSRVKLLNNLNLDTEIDVVLSILTFEHIGYRTPNNIMNIQDITFEIMKYTHPGTIWVLVEHEVEEPGWIDRWCGDFNINPDVRIKNWSRFPELNHRPNSNYDFIVWKQK
jgi:SAM-dependent methyltransferase